ncbi:MAG: T9SS type A sorting domain-containing protein, partial [Bacteroidia bacterium]|nr:T9SS type A sorting domain-containing protein [Bacteroidia bacterium]
FTPPYELTGGTDYYYGVAQITSGFIFATLDAPATMNLNLYYYSPLGGGSIGNPQNQMGYVAMNAVTMGTNMALSAQASQSLFCKDDAAASTLTLNAIGSLTSYTWTRNGTQGGVISTSSANAVVTPTIPSSIPSGTGTITYSVIGVDGPSGCRSNGAVVTVTVSACTAISENNTDGYNINVYPNPAVNSISTINGLAGTNEITVFNMVGQSVRTFKTNQESMELDLSGLPSGNYILRITGDNKQTRMVKIMK